MGDRANIYLKVPTGTGEVTGIYLYTHWSGYEWPEMLREALTFGQGRWDDDPYLARIIISRLFRDLVDEETGGGVSLYLTDNEWPITVCDLIEREVWFAKPGTESDPAPTERWTFAAYVRQERAEYPSDE